MPYPLRGLYAIADTSLLPEEAVVQAVGLAAQGGARVVQLRDKGEDPGRREWLAVDLLHVCRGLSIPLIVNDDVDLAERIGATGVHLGKDDLPVAEARRRLGPEAIIGASCYSSLEVAERAVADGATYVAFGRFFPSSTKPFALQAEVSLLTRAQQRLGVPVAAIGGITPQNGGELVAAGADMLAVVHGLFAQGDIRASAQQYARLFENDA
jgi:thiamine-phosphate pyrophosphorylase